MAGTGPAPKDNRQRARDEKAHPFETLPAEGYAGEYPPLPTTWTTMVNHTVENGDGSREIVSSKVRFTYLTATREWYEDHATSPQATRFTKTDWRRLRMIAPLVDQFNRRPTKDLASELRLQETLLGATVMDRQRMRLRVAQPAPVVAPRSGDGATVTNLDAERKARLAKPPE